MPRNQMAGFQEEDFSSTFDKCSQRGVRADWLRESNKIPSFIPGLSEFRSQGKQPFL